MAEANKDAGKKLGTKRLVMFLAICFGVAWTVELFGVIPMYRSGDANMLKEAVGLISQVMLTPALSALVTRLFTREGLVKSGLQFNFLEQRFLFLFGWFGMSILTLLGAVIYFAVFGDNFDPNMTKFVTLYRAKAEAPISDVEIVAGIKTDLLMKLFTAGVLDGINAFGEEWGFRAYLLPKLFHKIGTIPAVLVTSFVSGLWYAPLGTINYYYSEENSGAPVVYVFVTICLFGMVTGIIYAFLTLRTGSIFPAVFAHSALNVMMYQAKWFTFDGGNFFIGPSPTGILAGIPLIITAVVCLVSLHKHPIQASAEEE